MPSPRPDLPQRPVLAGYVVLEPLGRGATGAVWAVRDPDGVRLAAKVLPPGAERLDYEVSVLRSLRHEHVIRLHEAVCDTATEPAGTALIMQLAEGGSLADTLEHRDVLSPGELVTVLCPVARALHDLHGLGLVHGDLSPGNILLTAEGKPLIGDLGMSRLAGHADEEVWATEAWAAPEVLAGSGPVPASDVYSLGAIAWRALTGAPPEPAALRADLAELAPGLPDELRDLVVAALAHTAGARPLPGEFAAGLWRCAAPEPAPVQGSPARRGAPSAAGKGESDALTRRIRSQAAADLRSGAPRVRHAQPSKRRVSTRARRVLLALGVTAGVAGGLLVVIHVGVASRPASGTPAQSGQQAGAPPPASVVRSSSPPAPAPRAPTPPVDAVRVLQQLATARAAAWTSGDRVRLETAEVKGSPAYLRDSADLQSAAEEGVRYAGLRFTVRAAHAGPPTGQLMHLTAVIDRSVYTVVGPAGSWSVPADPARSADVSVRWTDHGWRVVDWAAPS